MKTTTLHSLDTEYSADSIEWCPSVNFENYFVCGTYQLEESENKNETEIPCKRKGRIYLYDYNIELDSLEKVQTVETSAVLDQKWKLNEKQSILGIANSIGEIQIYDLKNSKLNLKTSVNLNSEINDLLALSLDWSDDKIVSSDSKGNISILKFSNSELVVQQSWLAHGFEAWICCFDKWNKNVVYSGGDDMLLNIYDIRADSSSLKMKNKSHNAGVTALLSFEKSEFKLATGSYDENLRIFDTRYLKNCLSEINLNGGIWRIKSHPSNEDLLLCACMYHNFSFVEISNENKELNLIEEYFEHKSICYGSDWCFTTKDLKKSFFAVCSFYDHKLSVCSWNLS